MTVRDFVRKEVRTARSAGIRAAVKQGAVESAHFCYDKYNRQRSDAADRIWDREWDICVVIDACRHDLLYEARCDYDWLANWAGQAMWSVGSASPEWYGNTFAPGVLRGFDRQRVGVVTANPFSGKPAERAAGAPPDSLPLSEHGLGYLDEVWRDEWGVESESGYLDVTSPESVTQRACYAWETCDLDRLVVHYMQPHIPFRARPEWFGEHEDLQYFGEPSKEGGKDPWHRVRDDEIDEDEFLRAYRDNLDWVLPAVYDLYTHTGAELLLTSDHGNAIGEWGMWSHPPNVHLTALRRVPAVHLPATKPMHHIQAREPPDEAIGERMDDKLQALGYL